MQPTKIAERTIVAIAILCLLFDTFYSVLFENFGHVMSTILYPVKVIDSLSVYQQFYSHMAFCLLLLPVRFIFLSIKYYREKINIFQCFGRILNYTLLSYFLNPFMSIVFLVFFSIDNHTEYVQYSMQLFHWILITNYYAKVELV